MCIRDRDEVLEVHNPSGLPEITKVASIEEPYILAQIITCLLYTSSFISRAARLSA